MTKYENNPLNSRLCVALEAAQKGAHVLENFFGQISRIDEKKWQGLVSEADFESEYIITQYLRQAFPLDRIIAEEASFKNSKVNLMPNQKSKGYWVIDPLDGTTNYVHQFPVYCVSIGYEENGETLVGVVNVPFFKKVYSAVKGAGAFVNGQPIHVSQRKALEQSLLATGFYAHDAVSLRQQIQIFSLFLPQVRGIRRAGSAAFDLCLVAEGVFDAFWECRLQPWDTSAGHLIVREAGGQVSNYKGEKYFSSQGDILASNSHLHDQILAVIKNNTSD